MNWGAIIVWIVTRIPAFLGIIKQIGETAKPALESTKIGMGMLEDVKSLAKKDAEEKPEQATERIRALADFMRSFVLIVFAEALVYAVKSISLILLFKWATQYFLRDQVRK